MSALSGLPALSDVTATRLTAAVTTLAAVGALLGLMANSGASGTAAAGCADEPHPDRVTARPTPSRPRNSRRERWACGQGTRPG